AAPVHCRKQGQSPPKKNKSMAPLPRWDSECRELWLGDVLVKQFRVPAPNQESILNAFQEEGWPRRIDDPLTPQHNQDPKCRLHDAIDRLNRSQKKRLIRFRGDGKGEGVLWERIADESPTDRR